MKFSHIFKVFGYIPFFFLSGYVRVTTVPAKTISFRGLYGVNKLNRVYAFFISPLFNIIFTVIDVGTDQVLIKPSGKEGAWSADYLKTDQLIII